MAKDEKKLTKEQINAALRRPIQDGTQYNHLIDQPNLDVVSHEKGNTFFGVQMIKRWVLKYYKQVARLAPVLVGKDLEATTRNIHSFLLHNVQYQIDYIMQHIRSPANSWNNRQRGIECKNYTLFTSAILMNLGIKHYIRQVKQTYFEPKQFTHVYIVVPKNQVTANLDDGYFVIDATSKMNRESIIKEKNDVLMKGELPYVGLNAPAKKKPTAKQIAARKKFAKMAKDGTLAKKRKSAAKKSGLNAPVKKPASSTKKQFPFN
jgi:hypothetical protein